ncbi:MAG: polymer-forming cytoskeletal protein [Chloroflexia bacterium]|nr:polymer-forming cytoskeletal protein [Chloroflexia bacterium]
MKRSLVKPLLLFAILIVGSLFFAEPALAQGGPCSKIGGDLIIGSEQSCQGDATVIGGDLVILGSVEGNAVAMGGSVQVGGRVSGDVISVGGEILLREGCQVQGDAMAMEGVLQRAPNATVKGALWESSLFPASWYGEADRPLGGAWARIGVVILLSGLTFGICMLLAVVLRAFLPQRTQVVIETLRGRLVPSLTIGVITSLLLAMLLPLLSLLLLLIVIGIPLIPFLYVLVGVLWAVGLALSGIALGEALIAQTGRDSPAPWLPAALGLAILVPLTILPGVMIPCLGPAWAILAPSGGVGALLFSRAGTWAK